MKAIIHVALKPGVLDPQGKAVAHALQGMGFDEVESARQGKVIEINLDESDRGRAEARVKDMCEKLLSNPVIERYSVEIAG